MKTLQESMALVYQLHRSSAVSVLADDVKEAIQRLASKDRELFVLRAALKNADAVLTMLYTELGGEPHEALSRIRELKSKASWNCASSLHKCAACGELKVDEIDVGP